MNSRVLEIVYGSSEYEWECVLRDELLRVPLGLSLYDEDLAAEAAYHHLGIFNSISSDCVACLVAVPFDGGLFQLKQMVVKENWQKKGVGSRLLSEAEARLASYGARRFFLHARESATEFYRKHGYEPVGESFVEVTIPHIRMEKHIDGKN